MDTCIVIRSGLREDGVAHVQAGARVVYDSKPQAEADETRAKAAAVLAAIAASHGTSLLGPQRPAEQIQGREP